MNLDLVHLRYRASTKSSLCASNHEIHRADDGLAVWATCDGRELDRMALPRTNQDLSSDISGFMTQTLSYHERDVVSEIVLELVDRLEIGAELASKLLASLGGG